MTYKIPPSLNWLIDKRARLDGKMLRLKVKLAKVQPLIDQFNQLEKELTAIDQALLLHDIKIDANLIKPIRPQVRKENRVFKFPRGIPSKIVRNFFKSKYGQGPISKSEILDHLLQKHLEFDNVPVNRVEAGYYANALLNRLKYDGYIVSCHPPVTNSEGSWELHPNYISQQGLDK